MKIGIAGYGYVGQAHEYYLQKVHEISIADPAKNNTQIKDIVHDCQGIICCVSTPSKTDGSCNMDNVYNVLEQTPSNIPVLIRSTISVEGWDMINKEFPDHKITFCPEYLRAKKYIQDFILNQNLNMGGGDIQFWHDIFEPIMSQLKVGVVDPKVLIAGKYFRNSFLATKVAFFNQIFDYCQAQGIDYNLTAQVVGLDNRIGGSHTAITEERGFGGHCFPKDTQAIVKSGESKGVDLSIIQEAINYNNKIRKPGSDK